MLLPTTAAWKLQGKVWVHRARHSLQSCGPHMPSARPTQIYREQETLGVQGHQHSSWLWEHFHRAEYRRTAPNNIPTKSEPMRCTPMKTVPSAYVSVTGGQCPKVERVESSDRTQGRRPTVNGEAP
jgi:hypothetical protein